MKKKSKGRVWWWISILLVALAGLLAGYFLGMEQGREEAEKAPLERTTPALKKEPPAEVPVAKGPVALPESKELQPLDDKTYCDRMEEEIKEYFRYLNQKGYVRHLGETPDTYARFRAMIGKLSARLPTPAGEGIDSEIINDNIFFFFRVLDKNDLTLIRHILKNEEETLEPTLDLFYRWLTLGDRCPDPEGIRPSQEVLYHYAGFFLNTIGGRSYLFRRPLGLRLLGGYYSLLILHEMDKQGRNSYGVDVLPFITHLSREIALYSNQHGARSRKKGERKSHFRSWFPA